MADTLKHNTKNYQTDQKLEFQNQIDVARFKKVFAEK